MKWLLLTLFFLTALGEGFSQKASDALQGNYSLRDRYYLMKSSSQTYGDYKVIKQNVLDGVWKILQDSVASSKAALKALRARNPAACRPPAWVWRSALSTADSWT